MENVIGMPDNTRRYIADHLPNIAQAKHIYVTDALNPERGKPVIGGGKCGAYVSLIDGEWIITLAIPS